MRIGFDDAVARYRADEVPFQKRMILMLVIFAGSAAVFLLWRWTAFHVVNTAAEQLKILWAAVANGMLLALSGTIFQNVFRNPMAAPTMLGVSTGVQVATILVIIAYGGMAVLFPLQRYAATYVGAFAMFALILFVGKLASGPGKFRIADLLLVGICVSSIVGALTSAYLMAAEDEFLDTYMQLMDRSSPDIGRLPMLSLTVTAIAVLVFFWLTRFSMNTLGLPVDETRMLGVHPFRIRVLALVCATFMVTTSMLSCGMIAMLALIIPYISRFLFGPEFRRQFWGNLLLGATIMVVCTKAAQALPIFYDKGFPVVFVINIFIAPLFAFVVGISKNRMGSDR